MTGGRKWGSVSQGEAVLWVIVTHVDESPLSHLLVLTGARVPYTRAPKLSPLDQLGPCWSPGSVCVALRGQMCVRSVAVTRPAQMGKVEGSWVETGSGFQGGS